MEISDRAIPIIVDLDGSLIKTDLLFESANWFIANNFFSLFFLIVWIAGGKSFIKTKLANVYPIDPSILPYNINLIFWLKNQHNQGRQIILATASHMNLAKLVIAHVNFFDDLLATNKNLNLIGSNKRNELVRIFGENGYDYIGNSSKDIPVWKSARNAYIVTASPSLIAKVKAMGNLAQVFDDDRPPIWRSLLKSMRPHQWLKNLIIFIPLFAAHAYDDISNIKIISLAFLAFGLTASATYILNDLVDVEYDRRHPRKCLRPFSAGDISLLSGWLIWPIILFIAFTISIATLPKPFLVALSAYLALNFAYSFFLKKKAIIDVITLASLYTTRIIAGILALGVPLSFWLLSFSMFFFLSLALLKRFIEIKYVDFSDPSLKLAGRGYYPDDLSSVSSMGIASGYISVLVLALYVQDANVSHRFHQPEFIWLACPLLFFWISRIWLLVHRGRLDDDPVFFAAKDGVSWLILAGFVVLFLCAKLV